MSAMPARAGGLCVRSPQIHLPGAPSIAYGAYFIAHYPPSTLYPPQTDAHTYEKGERPVAQTLHLLIQIERPGTKL
jgi:hypothetical protein